MHLTEMKFLQRRLISCKAIIKMFAFLFIIHGIFTIPFSAADGLMSTCQPSPKPCQYKQTRTGLYADCSKRGLTATPCGLPLEIASLRLDINNITTLNHGSFTNIPNLKVLSITNNFMQHIEEDTFIELPFLEKIVLSHNKLISLPEEVFLNNHNLQTIILTTNNFRALPGALKSLKCASKISLEHNLIDELDFKGVSFTNMTHLSISYNKLSYMVTEDFLPLSTSHIRLYDLSRNNFMVLNDSVFQHLKFVKILILDKNKISDYLLSSTVGMTSLEILYIRGCRVKTIHGFTNTTSKRTIIPPLKELYLAQNSLSTIPAKAFHGLDNLIHLDLAQSKISLLHNDSFYGLSALRYLDLKGNQLHEVNTEIFLQLPSLCTLQLSHNQFTVLSPLQFRGITPMKFLDLSYNKIKDFDPSSSWDVPSLDTLDLTKNHIFSLQPGLFRGLRSLKTLILSSNPIEIWGKYAFAGLENLTNLIISRLDSRLSNVNFRGLENLLHLDMSHSYFNNIELKNMLFLPSLVHLKMEYAHIGREDLRKQVFSHLSSLKTLLLSGNPLDPILPGTFDGLAALRFLDLHKCSITVLPNNTFRNLTLLTKLDLKQNNIQSLSSELLRAMPSLVTIIIEKNKIHGVLDRNLFMYNKKLGHINLANNLITGFEENIFRTVRTLDVSGNPLACTCDLQWFQHLLEKGNITLYNPHKTNCSVNSISQFKGKPLLEFHPDGHCGPNISAYVFGALLAVALISAIVVSYRHRWWLNYACFHVKLLIIGYDEMQDGRGPLDYVYDINVIFPDDDEAWAQEEFVAAFEEHLPDFPRNRVVCGEDDLPLGGTRLDAIDYVIENSYKIIVIISNAAVNDAHFMTQLQMVVEHMNEVQLEKVVLVFREEVPDNQLPYLARLFLSRNKPYFEWTEERYGKRFFWQKLARTLRYNKKMNSILPL